jgi:hypothetical protein
MKDIRVSFPKPCREDWNEMTPEGRNRFCGECSKTIHDLRRYRWDEVDALLRSGEEVCVRAEIGKSDVVALRSDSMRKAGRIIATISASVGLASLSAPVFAGKRGPEGTIAGKVDYAWPQILVTATSADGTKHISKTNWKGRYKIKHLPPGSYKIAFYDGETDWVGPDAVVEDRKTAIRDTENPNPPIIVGMIQVELNGG